jgi:hypothetical protein
MREEVILDVKAAFFRESRGTESEKARTWAIISQGIRKSMYTRSAPVANAHVVDEKVDIATDASAGASGTGERDASPCRPCNAHERGGSQPAVPPDDTQHGADVQIGEFSDGEGDDDDDAAAAVPAIHLGNVTEEQAREPDLCSDDDDEHDTDADRMLSDPTLPWDHAACQAEKLERDSQSWTVHASGCLLETADHTKSMPIGYANARACVCVVCI